MFAKTKADVTPMKPKKGALVGHVSVDMVFPLSSSRRLVKPARNSFVG